MSLVSVVSLVSSLSAAEEIGVTAESELKGVKELEVEDDVVEFSLLLWLVEEMLLRESVVMILEMGPVEVEGGSTITAVKFSAFIFLFAFLVSSASLLILYSIKVASFFSTSLILTSDLLTCSLNSFFPVLIATESLFVSFFRSFVSSFNFFVLQN